MRGSRKTYLRTRSNCLRSARWLFRRGRWLGAEIAGPNFLEPHQGLVQRQHRQAAASAFQQPEALQLEQRIADFEIERDAECLFQPGLDAPVEVGLGRRRL